MLDPYEAREAIAPTPTQTADVLLSGLPAVGGGMVQGATDDAPWKPAGYVPETGTVLVLTIDGHAVALPGADLVARLAALEA